MPLHVDLGDFIDLVFVLVACQLLDVKGDLERHEEAKELVILLTTEAKDDPEIRSQVEHVRFGLRCQQFWPGGAPP